MKVCVSSYGPTLDSREQPVFGRCAYFILVDPENMEFESVPNPNASFSEDAGILSAQFVVARGVSVILADQVGAKAESILQTANVETIPTGAGTVREAVEAFRNRYKLKA